MPALRLRSVAAALLAAALALTIPMGASASAPLPIVAAPLGSGAGHAPWVPNRLIIRWRDGTTADGRRATRAAERLDRLRDLGSPDLELVATPGERPDLVAARLAHDPHVAYAEPDYVVAPSLKPTDEAYFDELWGLANSGQVVNGSPGTAGIDIDFPQAANVTRGDPGLVVAVIDDGVDLGHPDLVDRAWTNPGESGGGRETNGIDDDGNGFVDDVHGWDFVHDDASVHDVNEDFHGTHVAGTIAASLNGVGIVGVAPRVKIMALKFLGPSGGSTSDAIAAVNYAAANGADVMNASWGGPGASLALRDAISASGMLLVAAAGNDGIDNDTDPQRSYPASYDLDNIIAVAAIDQDGQVPSFSNHGATTVDLAAPGVNILSCYPERTVAPINPPALAFMDGTSMAAPHVAGVAALVLSVRPGLRSNPAKLRQLIIDTATDAPATVGSTASGRLVNARGAVDLVAPKVTAPRLRLAVHAAIGAAGTPVRMLWSGTDAASGIDHFRAQLRTDGGAWVRMPLPGPTATEITRKLGAGHVYQIRVRAWDHAGNRSDWELSDEFRVAIREEWASMLTFSGTWQRPAVSTASGGRLRTSDEPNASVTFTFTGRAVGWVAEFAPTSGKARVLVDGIQVATVDLGTSGSHPRWIAYQRSWGMVATHTIEIRVLGTPARPTVTLDAVTWLR